MIKLVACDLDGTLLSSNRQVSQENLQAIKKMQEKGIPFVVATGRIYASAKDYAKSLDLQTPVIACNGAVVVDPVDDSILFEYPITSENAYRLIEIGHQHKIHFHFYDLDTVYMEKNNVLMDEFDRMNVSSPSKNAMNIKIVEDLASIVKDTTLYKLGLKSDQPFAKEAIEAMASIEGLTVCYSLTYLADIFNENASKGQAVKDVASLYHLDLSEVMAIGDNENDVSMLKAAGVGVAMFQARDFVKEAANEVTSSNDDNGVAAVINKYLDL